MFAAHLNNLNHLPQVPLSEVSNIGYQRTLRHPGYAISQCCRKRIEEVFGWIKTTAGVAQLKVRGLAKVRAVFIFALLAYNLVRTPKLLEAT